MRSLLISSTILTVCCICSAGPVARQVRQGSGPVVVIPNQQEYFRPYDFGYEFGDGLGMTQHRQEVADGTGAVSGSYGYLDPLGVSRVVEYKADRDGYKAVIRSNEPGMAGQNAADTVFVVQPPPPFSVAQGL